MDARLCIPHGGTRGDDVQGASSSPPTHPQLPAIKTWAQFSNCRCPLQDETRPGAKKGLVPLAIFLSRRAIVYTREGGGDSRGRKRQRQRILELDTRGVGQGKVAGLFILCSFFLGLENCVLVFSSSSPHLRRLSDRVAPMRNLGGGQEVWPEDWLGLRPQRACKISLHENTLLSFTL